MWGKRAVQRESSGWRVREDEGKEERLKKKSGGKWARVEELEIQGG